MRLGFRRFTTVKDVVDWNLCLGCGICAPVCPSSKISLQNILHHGIRPTLSDTQCGTCNDCLLVCPGVGTDVSGRDHTDSVEKHEWSGFGPILEVWEVAACDEEIRFKGSSGGALTALALCALESNLVGGVLHIGSHEGDPIQNTTIYSKHRDELIRACGSRYAPASVCDGLPKILVEPMPSLIIGQPSEIAALEKLSILQPCYRKKVPYKLSFFCAGSPSTLGTIELLKMIGLESASLAAVRYRGNGWPGMFSTTPKGNNRTKGHFTYKESWSILQKFRPFSTHLYPDGSGEFADISCGDPWYREIQPNEHGSSLVVIRSEAGRDLFQRALRGNYLRGTKLGIHELKMSQANLLSKRGAVFGRLIAMNLLCIPTPRHRGYSLFDAWMLLSLSDKIRSVIGTVQRVCSRKLYVRGLESARK